MATFDRAYGALARQNRREQLLNAHLPLVKHMVGRVAMELPEGVGLDPLEAGGLFGLLDAISKFDPLKDGDFATEARDKISQGIYDALRREWNLDDTTAEYLVRIQDAYPRLASPVDLPGLALASSLTIDEVVDALIALRLLQRLRPIAGTEAIAFDVAEERAAEWAKGRLDPSLHTLFTLLDTVATRLLTLFFREDLRLQEVSEILRLPQLETKRIYRRTLWGIGESLRQTR